MRKILKHYTQDAHTHKNTLQKQAVWGAVWKKTILGLFRP